MVFLNKALLTPFVWGGRLTSHESGSNQLMHCFHPKSYEDVSSPPNLWLSHPPTAQPAEKEILLCWRSRPFANHTKDKVHWIWWKQTRLHHLLLWRNMLRRTFFFKTLGGNENQQKKNTKLTKKWSLKNLFLTGKLPQTPGIPGRFLFKFEGGFKFLPPMKKSDRNRPSLGRIFRI